MRVTPYEWFKWTSPGSQLSLRGGVLETEMGQFFRKWLVGEGLLPTYSVWPRRFWQPNAASK